MRLHASRIASLDVMFVFNTHPSKLNNVHYSAFRAVVKIFFRNPLTSIDVLHII